MFDAKAFVEAEFRKVLKYEREDTKRFDLRGSSLPFCSIYLLHDILQDPNRLEDYPFIHYTSIGTAVHERVLQHCWPRAEGLRGLPVGYWSCEKCKAKTREIGPAPSGMLCPEAGCDGTVVYTEIDFLWRGLSGHLDMLLRLPDGSHIALEFKTTSADTIAKGAKWLPQKKHTVQIETYCLLLWLVHRIRVRAYAIIYVDRDKPPVPRPSGDRARHFVHTRRVDNDLMRFHARHLTKASRAFASAAKLLSLHREGRRDRKTYMRLLRTIQEDRPCRSREDYAAYMDRYFFGQNKCPFVHACSQGMAEDELIRPIIDIYHMLTEEEEEEPGAERDRHSRHEDGRDRVALPRKGSGVVQPLARPRKQRQVRASVRPQRAPPW